MTSSDLERRVAMISPDAHRSVIEADHEAWYDLFPELYEPENGVFFSTETKRTARVLKNWLEAGEAIFVEPYGDPMRRAAYVRKAALADYAGITASSTLEA